MMQRDFHDYVDFEAGLVDRTIFSDEEIYQLETGFTQDVDVGVPARAPQDRPSS